MIYVDSSVVLAAVLAEDRAPSPEFWQAGGFSSRLMQYEVVNRLDAYNATTLERSGATDLIDSLTLIELSPVVLQRALRPWPAPVRTLDALHLATAIFLTSQNAHVIVATYDIRMARAATSVGLAIVEPA